MYLHVYLCNVYVQALMGPEEGVGTPGARVIGGRELPDVGAGK